MTSDPTLPLSDDPVLLIHAYLDGELEPSAALAVERRIAGDPRLAAERDRILALRRALQEHLPREAPSDALRDRIGKAVGLRTPRPRPTWTALAASIALTALVTGSSAWMWRGDDGATAATDAILSAHMRAMMAPQPADVLSTERHTVKPWFTGRVPEAPRVINLAASGFPLIGGRVDVIGRQPAPTLVYGRRAHRISLIALEAPGKGDRAPAARIAAGHNMVAWTMNGVDYWAISDVSAKDLDLFVELFRTAPPDQ
jgi:anti-sigma factor RsiW